MSNVPPNMPPNMPPGGGAPPPIPPYDPKTQWRVYREQQRAARRAQRDAWRAQRHAWKANYPGAYGPRVPSVVGPVILVCVGVVALLVVTGHIDSAAFWTWYGHWWPLLLIAAGLALLAPRGSSDAAIPRSSNAGAECVLSRPPSSMIRMRPPQLESQSASVLK